METTHPQILSVKQCIRRAWWGFFATVSGKTTELAAGVNMAEKALAKEN
jgi:hypothetical protein